MHKYNGLFFSVLIFLAACRGDGVPSGIIGGDKMVSLLTEVHIVDGSIYNVMQVPDSLYKYGTAKYVDLFKKFDTDSVQFKKSFQFYSEHPDMMAAIYGRVTINIKNKTDSLNKLNQVQMAKDNKRRADSLKKLPKDTLHKPVIPALPGAKFPHSHLKRSTNPHDI